MRPTRVTGPPAVPDAVDRLLRKFEYPRDAVFPSPPIVGGGGGAPTAVVAASNATDLSKSKSDFFCSGSGDDVVLSDVGQFLSGLGVDGARILLTEGDFTFDSTWTVPDGIYIQGMGPRATRVEGIDVVPFSLAGYGAITALRATGGSAGCVRVGSAGLVAITDCQFFLAAFGVEKTGAAFTNIERCRFDSNLTDGVIVGSGTGDTLISRNEFNVGTTGVDLLGAGSNAEVIIADNYFSSSVNTGIQAATSTRLIIRDNILDQVSGHGFSLTAVSDSVIADNLIYRPGTGTDNTFDGILLAGNSDRNLIHGNAIHPADSAGNQTRYGVNISDAACNDNAVFANYLGDSSEYGTADSNDAGTGTILAAAGGAIGGQFAY